MVRLKLPSFSFGSFLSGLNNALLKGNSSFFVHYSKLNCLVCEYLYKNHFFSEVFYIYSNRNLCCYIFVRLENYEGDLVLKNVRSLYKKSRPLFFHHSQIQNKLLREKTVYLLSTSEGVVNSIEAIHMGIGGLALFEYY